MTKVYRLSHVDFSALTTLRRENGRFFTLTVSKSPDNKPRFACVVSKKTAQKAHERNLIKRRARAVFKEVVLQIPFAFVFTAKRSIQDATFEESSNDMKSLFEKATAGLK